MSDIGRWLARYSSSGAQVTRAHLVESEVADDVITRCGRRMARRDDLAEALVSRCRQCWRGVLV